MGIDLSAAPSRDPGGIGSVRAERISFEESGSLHPASRSRGTASTRQGAQAPPGAARPLSTGHARAVQPRAGVGFVGARPSRSVQRIETRHDDRGAGLVGRAHREAPGQQAVRGAALGGELRGLPESGPPEPAGHAHRLPEDLRHDPQPREDGVHRQQEEAHPLPLLQRRALRRPRRDLRPRRPADEAGERLQVRRAAVRHGEARHPPARAGGLVSKSTIARLLKKGMEEYSQDPRGGGLHLRLEPREEGQRRRAPQGADEVPDERGAAQPHPAASGARRSSPSSARTESGFAIPDGQRAVPRLPLRVQGADDGVRRRLRPSSSSTSGSTGSSSARRTGSASAPSSPRTRRTRTPPSSPATSTTGRSPSTAATPTPGPSTSTASSTSPTAESSSSSRC